jgi:hypothetical protein
MPSRILRDWTDSERVNAISPHAERLFVRLIMKMDDYGCFHADPRLVRANLFPLLIDQIREADISRWIAECEKAGLVRSYEVASKPFLVVPNHGQRMKNSRRRFPAPPSNLANFPEVAGSGGNSPEVPGSSGKSPPESESESESESETPQPPEVVRVLESPDEPTGGVMQLTIRPPQFQPHQARELYDAYPRREAWARAKNEIERALSAIAHRENAPPDPFAWLMSRVQLFARSAAGNRGNKTPMPATWFSDQRYDDDESAWNRRDPDTHPHGTMPNAVNAGKAMRAAESAIDPLKAVAASLAIAKKGPTP